LGGALKRLEKDEVSLTEVIDVMRREQETTIINESGEKLVQKIFVSGQNSERESAKVDTLGGTPKAIERSHLM
jgi:prophage antirepressor-like protein